MKVEIPKTPDWIVWKHAATVELLEGVLLSLNIDPADYRWCCGAGLPKYAGPHDERTHRASAALNLAKNDDRCKHISGRRLVALRNVGQPGKLLPGYVYPASDDTKVQLLEFVQWSQTVEWSIPEPLKELIGSSPSASNRWPWGTYETKYLRSLADAARRFWVNYDPADDTTAARNEDVVDWLIEEHGISKRIAEAMATILRVDGLKTGPRSDS
jgi:hypothetical protein